ncbi:type IV toxin-antitoxin system AbiEi family antitoxin domain-containing protein [Rhizobium leguminosarum]|uniref:type IV toxin-antitoxin system AbiEi family antitoxin domain-containing protein n=1 Tax=Rhizobium leguminosarum TaxID=384 RepID=UPI0021B0DB9F
MTFTTAQRLRALNLLKARGMLRLKDFVAEGIGPETLARLVREEAVVRPARGLYQLPDTQAEAADALAEAAVLVPKGVVCLTSALQYHELTLQMPSAVWMAIDRTAWRPKIDYPPIKFVRFKGSALTEGVERHRIEGVEVPITNPARSIVDCFRYRAKVGLDVAMEGLREGLRRRKRRPLDICERGEDLVDHATLCRSDGGRWRVTQEKRRGIGGRSLVANGWRPHHPPWARWSLISDASYCR